MYMDTGSTAIRGLDLRKSHVAHQSLPQAAMAPAGVPVALELLGPSPLQASPEAHSSCYHLTYQVPVLVGIHAHSLPVHPSVIPPTWSWLFYTTLFSLQLQLLHASLQPSQYSSIRCAFSSRPGVLLKTFFPTPTAPRPSLSPYHQCIHHISSTICTSPVTSVGARH